MPNTSSGNDLTSRTRLERTVSGVFAISPSCAVVPSPCRLERTSTLREPRVVRRIRIATAPQRPAPAPQPKSRTILLGLKTRAQFCELCRREREGAWASEEVHDIGIPSALYKDHISLEPPKHGLAGHGVCPSSSEIQQRDWTLEVNCGYQSVHHEWGRGGDQDGGPSGRAVTRG